MAEMSESEYRLFNALSETTPYSVVELAESAGLTAGQVQRLVQTLAGDGRVTADRRDGRTEYRLSPTGVGQRTMMRGLAKDGPVGLDEFANAFSMAKHQAGIAATRERMADVPLTDRERSICSAALTWQHEQSRFDWSELIKRRALLESAVTHGQLIEVFDGLQMPPLYGEHRAAPAGVPWSMIGAGLRLLFCLPFLMAGLGIMKDASTVQEFLGGAVFLGAASFIAYPAVRRILARRRS